MAETAHHLSRTPSLAVLDAHCHIDLYPDPAAVVARAEASKTRTIAVTNAPSVYPHTRDLVKDSRYVRAAIGFHPELVHSHSHELDDFWPHLATTRYVGEVGLDFVTTDQVLRDLQQHVFSSIVERCATAGDKVLTIHSRRAVSDVLSIVGDAFPGYAILHWFSGTPKQLERAVASGFYFSVNPAMVLSESGTALVAAMPRDRVLTETDGPFVNIGARQAEPTDVSIVVSALAQFWRVAPEEAAATIFANLRSLC